MRADRLLSILLQLQLHGRLTARDLAKRLQVSQRTIHRDMGALGSAGVPVVAERGVGGGWSLMEGYRANLTGLSESELQAMIVTRPEKLLANLKLVLPKLTQRNAELARQRIFIDVSGWNRSNEQVPYLPLLQDAVWRDRKVRMMYGDDCASERIVDPLGLVAKGNVWYLVARIGARASSPRSYRVSRVHEATILDASFVRPGEFDLEKFWEESSRQFKERLPRYEVVIRASAPVVKWLRTMMRYGGIDDVTGDRVRLHFDAEEVAKTVLLGIGDQIEIVEPQSLRESIVATARRIATAGG
ncbi:MAG: WYL domain-containing protein [Acidobacteriota bacterium]|nr:WYL domain-containing protein [Acidobacteriota bacterium]